MARGFEYFGLKVYLPNPGQPSYVPGEDRQRLNRVGHKRNQTRRRFGGRQPL
ncbi:hypothetical protein HMPREF0574_1721 [Mobiluncus curtisii subsp. curtisii ATCC 35241]|uniref:Uncharacterized protein n=3 Tax=Mobiluncus TaxID=2050 RepID=D6ZIS9_MOBCV|nr:hypothetical protein HMPREF0573_10309 [Mobiluncus curtisii ATCC 43063]EFL93120.1 hypothetical protein HMPREF0574_1721 [Mobiluncus curtisii subsp. curtisii ATCC 35241]EFU82835.1 hypothetical protein HMPREF0576_0165 [Mobiluncus holmesii ATCC 35242]MCU9986876.1 recombinase RecX [Mobiluncus curtisii]MCU9999776.1 recombinase RecX [Mobiluncus curtisii]